MPYGDKNKNSRRFGESGIPFNVSAFSVPTPDVRWEISFFSGSFECRPYDAATGAPRTDVIAGVTLYAPRLPGRTPQQVAHIGGSSGSLISGHAVLIDCGAGVLHISWNFDEYKHPEIN